MTTLIDELAPAGRADDAPGDDATDTAETPTTTDLEAVVEALSTNERFLVVSHENPDGDALGSMLAMTLGLRELGKDALMYLAGDAPLPAEFGFLGARRPAPRAAGRHRRACPARGRLRERAPDRARPGDPRPGEARRRRRPPPRQHALRRDEPDRRRRLVDRRDRARPALGARRAADAGDRGGALRRPRHRHRPLPVLEHDAEVAAPRGRARRGRAPTCTGSSAASTRPCSSRS